MKLINFKFQKQTSKAAERTDAQRCFFIINIGGAPRPKGIRKLDIQAKFETRKKKKQKMKKELRTEKDFALWI